MSDRIKGIVSKRLKDRRIELKMSLQEVAGPAGISKSTLHRYESGFERFPINKLFKLADVLQTSVEYLAGWGSKDLRHSYYEPLNSLLKELSFTIEYDTETDSFVMNNEDSSYPITVDQIKELKSSILAYAKFRISEIINSGEEQEQ